MRCGAVAMVISGGQRQLTSLRLAMDREDDPGQRGGQSPAGVLFQICGGAMVVRATGGG